MYRITEYSSLQERRLRIALTWLGAGSALLLLQWLTPLTLFAASWGRTPLFWLLLAPLSVLLALRPAWPLHWLAQRLRQRGYR